MDWAVHERAVNEAKMVKMRPKIAEDKGQTYCYELSAYNLDYNPGRGETRKSISIILKQLSSKLQKEKCDSVINLCCVYSWLYTLLGYCLLGIASSTTVERHALSVAAANLREIEARMCYCHCNGSNGRHTGENVS